MASESSEKSYRRKAPYWPKRIAEWSDSSLGQAEYCHRSGIARNNGHLVRQSKPG